MECPLCCTELKQHLLEPSVALISCPSESCIYPFNLTMSELHENNLLLTNITDADIMRGMKSKMVDEAQINERVAELISREDKDIF